MNTLLQKDLAVAQRLYDKIFKNKDNFLELLDNILDLTTFIPICIAEYGKDFASVDLDKLILDDINDILNEYGLYIANL